MGLSPSRPRPVPPRDPKRKQRIRSLSPLLCGILLPLLLGTSPSAAQTTSSSPAAFPGFDRNTFPGTASLSTLRQHFSYVGYWLNVPPGARTNSWQGTRAALAHAGFGFLILWNGRLDAQIKYQLRHAHISPETLGRTDAAAAVLAARHEGFPSSAILFLDQEEGGRLLPEQAAYLLAWTEAVAASGFRPGVYASSQPVDDGVDRGGHPQTITTAEDITEQVRKGHLHPVALWVAQDACGPSPGCTLTPPPMAASGTPGALVWQYAQSPRRPEITRSCARTYAADGNCIVPALPSLFLDLNVSSSPDPSGGR